MLQRADDVSTCVTAFVGCHGDDTCRPRLRTMLSECSGLPHESCNRSVCLSAVRSLYSSATPERAEALRFCRCGANDSRCDTIRRSLQPACSRLQLPPASCLDLISRCARNPDCRCVVGISLI